MILQSVTEFFRMIFQTLFSLLKIIILSSFFDRLKKSKVKNEECVILGNGPSLNNDLEASGNFIYARKKIAVNLFAFSHQFSIVKPDYYVLAAPEFFLKNTTKAHKEARNKLANELITHTNWPMVLITPVSSRNSDLIKKLVVNKNINIIHFNTTPVEGFKFITNLLYKMNLGIPRPHNVLIPSVYIALNLGFKKIFLFGADHSWHEDIRIGSDNRATINHEHFYDTQKVWLPMLKLDGQEYYIHDIFRKLHFAFKGYFVLRDYSKFLKAKILNASSKSYIDAFERIDTRS